MFKHGLSGYDHHACRCDACSSAKREANRRWRNSNPEKVKDNRRKYGLTPGRKSASKKWAKENKDKLRESQAQWRDRNPGYNNVNAARYRARKNGAVTFTYTKKDWERAIDRTRGECYYCHSNSDLTQDHVIPLSRGGSHGTGNIVPACKSCNSSKRNSLLIEWRRGTTP